MPVKPISPSDVTKAKAQAMPDFVIEVVNMMIVQKWDGHEATLLQCDVVDALVKQMVHDRLSGDLTSEFTGTELLEIQRRYSREIFDSHWLDFEDAFRKAGWTVTYDKPAYCDTYNANWTFKKKGSR